MRRKKKLFDWDRVRDAARGAVEGYTGADRAREAEARAQGVLRGADVALAATERRARSAETLSMPVVLGMAALAAFALLRGK